MPRSALIIGPPTNTPSPALPLGKGEGEKLDKTKSPPYQGGDLEGVFFGSLDQTMIKAPRSPVEANSRMSLRISAEDKALLLREVSLQSTSLTDFVLHTAVTAAREIIDEHERPRLSERDSLKVLDLLENPPEPNEKLKATAWALPDWR